MEPETQLQDFNNALRALTDVIDKNYDEIVSKVMEHGEYTDYKEIYFEFLNRNLVEKVGSDELVEKLFNMFISHNY